MYGADVQNLEALAVRMTAGADQLERIRATVRSGLHGVRWGGSDAEHTRQQWEAFSGPALANAARGLRETAQRLRENAKQQSQASSANDAPSAAGAAAARLLAEAGRVGRLGTVMSPLALAGFIAGGIDENVIKHLGLILDAKGLPTSWTAAGAAAAKLSGGSAVFGGLALASFLGSQIFPGQRFGFEAAQHGFEVGSAGLKLASEFASHGAMAGRLGPALGVVSGGLGLIHDFGEASTEGWTGANIAHATGHGLVAAGSVVMLLPVPGVAQLVGAGMVATGTVIDAGVWAYENWDHLSPYLDAGVDSVVGGAGAVAHAVVDAGTTVSHAVDAVSDNISHATASTWHAIKGLF